MHILPESGDSARPQGDVHELKRTRKRLLHIRHLDSPTHIQVKPVLPAHVQRDRVNGLSQNGSARDAPFIPYGLLPCCPELLPHIHRRRQKRRLAIA